ADRPQRLADEILVGERSVRFGGIEERDPAVDGSANDRDPFLAARRLPVPEADPHTAEAQRRNFQAVSAQGSFLHDASLPPIGRVSRGQTDEPDVPLPIRAIDGVRPRSLMEELLIYCPQVFDVVKMPAPASTAPMATLHPTELGGFAPGVVVAPESAQFLCFTQ